MRSSEVLVILLLILVNGFFALSEMALVSAKRSRLQAAAEQGRTGAKSAIALMEDPTTLLSAIQIGITLIAIFTGLYSGATFAEPLAGTLAGYGVPLRYAEEIAYLHRGGGHRLRHARSSASWCPSAWRCCTPKRSRCASHPSCACSRHSRRPRSGCCARRSTRS